MRCTEIEIDRDRDIDRDFEMEKYEMQIKISNMYRDRNIDRGRAIQMGIMTDGVVTDRQKYKKLSLRLSVLPSLWVHLTLPLSLCSPSFV